MNKILKKETKKTNYKQTFEENVDLPQYEDNDVNLKSHLTNEFNNSEDKKNLSNENNEDKLAYNYSLISKGRITAEFSKNNNIDINQ